MPLGWYYSDPGAKFSSSQVKDAMDARVGSVLLFPVYDAVQGNGSNLQYHIVGWAGFYMTGWTAHGNNATISGYLKHVAWEGLPSTSRGELLRCGRREAHRLARNSSSALRKVTVKVAGAAADRARSDPRPGRTGDMTYRLRNILIAVGLAVVAALLTVFYVSNYKSNVRADSETVSVLVAARDIPQGMLGPQVMARRC